MQGAGNDAVTGLAAPLAAAVAALEETTDSLLATGAESPAAAMAVAFDYLMLVGDVAGFWQMARAALAAQAALDAGTEPPGFYRAKLGTARASTPTRCCRRRRRMPGWWPTASRP